MIEEIPVTGRLRYLAKVLTGLLLLGAVIAIGTDASLMARFGFMSSVAVALLALILFGIAPLVLIVYRRMDELNRSLHQQACAVGLPLTAACCGGVGVLQAQGLLPLFNQLWTLLAVVLGLGLSLMLCDRKYR